MKIVRNFSANILYLFLALLITFPVKADQENDLILAYFDKIEYHKKANGEAFLSALLIDDEEAEPVSGILVNFYANDISQEAWLANTSTDKNGIAKVKLPAHLTKYFDEDGMIEFIVSSSGDGIYEVEKETLSIQNAGLELNMNEDDSSLSAFAYIINEDGKVPVDFEDISFYAQRSLALLSIGGDYTITDEDGMVVSEFPIGLPGDKNGNVIIIARFADEFTYGIVDAQITVPWGRIIEHQNFSKLRGLWAGKGRAPLWLAFIVNGMIIGALISFIYIFYLLFKLNRITKN